MRSRILWALAVLNVLLVGLLVWRMTESTAHAQAARRPGDYIAVPGHVLNTQQGVVYVVDSNNGLLTALMYDPSAKRIVPLAPLSLNRLLTDRP